MPENRAFPHLQWTYTGVFEPSFNGNRMTPKGVRWAKDDRAGHVSKIKGQLGSMRENASIDAEARRAEGLPEITGKGFLIRVPEGTDVDALAYSLGIELVAETESGLMFAASDSLDFDRLEQVLAQFEINVIGGGVAATIFGVFHEKDDERKLAELLIGRIHDLWPFEDGTIYTFDLGIQTARSSKKVEWTRLPPRPRGQTKEDRDKQVSIVRGADRIKAEEQWADSADERFSDLQSQISYYGGEVVDGLKHNDLRETRKSISFPDSIEVRVRMSGKGFRDLIENYRHLFEVTIPPDVRYLPGSSETEGEEGDLNILPPSDDAPKVCVIDSGIQEEHRWLEPAIDKPSSLCFLPECEPNDMADYFSPRGHGTRVAGAILYPREVPKEASSAKSVGATES